MFDALIAGRLAGKPQERTARNGRPYVTARLRLTQHAPDPARGVPETLFVVVVAFRDAVVAALSALADGDAVTLAGELTVGTWAAEDGTVRPSLSLTAHAVLTEYHVARRRHAMDDRGRTPTARAATAEPEFNDAIPF